MRWILAALLAGVVMTSPSQGGPVNEAAYKATFCMTHEKTCQLYSVYATFAWDWRDGVVQAFESSRRSGKTPGVLLIVNHPGDCRHRRELQATALKAGKWVQTWIVGPAAAFCNEGYASVQGLYRAYQPHLEAAYREFPHSARPKEWAAQLWSESAGRACVRSKAGAIGMSQIIPPTLKQITKALDIPYDITVACDPGFSIRGGAYYMHWLGQFFVGHTDKLDLQRAAYNCGPDCVKRALRRCEKNWRRCIPNETKQYLRNIGRAYKALGGE